MELADQTPCLVTPPWVPTNSIQQQKPSVYTTIDAIAKASQNHSEYHSEYPWHEVVQTDSRFSEHEPSISYESFWTEFSGCQQEARVVSTSRKPSSSIHWDLGKKLLHRPMKRSDHRWSFTTAKDSSEINKTHGMLRRGSFVNKRFRFHHRPWITINGCQFEMLMLQKFHQVRPFGKQGNSEHLSSMGIPTVWMEPSVKHTWKRWASL